MVPVSQVSVCGAWSCVTDRSYCWSYIIISHYEKFFVLRIVLLVLLMLDVLDGTSICITELYLYYSTLGLLPSKDEMCSVIYVIIRTAKIRYISPLATCCLKLQTIFSRKLMHMYLYKYTISTLQNCTTAKFILNYCNSNWQ